MSSRASTMPASLAHLTAAPRERYQVFLTTACMVLLPDHGDQV